MTSTLFTMSQRYVGSPQLNAALLTSALLMFVGLSSVSPAQSFQQSATGAPPQSFEVASVRQQEKPAFRRSVISALPGGRFQATNATVRDLIVYAYDLGRLDTVEGGPSWAFSDKFDIAATTPQDWPSGEIGGQTARRMLQALLAERFKLTLQRDNRTQSGYALVLARADRRLGPRIKKSATDCAQLETARMARIADGGNAAAPENRPDKCNVWSTGGTAVFSGHTMADLARYFSNNMRQVVVDRTGLIGPYAIELTAQPGFVPELAKAEMLAKGIEFTEPPLEVALREQLGVKLEKTSVESDTILIESVARPTPN